MKVEGQHFRTIWRKKDDPSVVQIIDQRHLPHRFVIEDLRTVDEVVVAISEMHVRGAGLIGAAAGYGMYLGGLTSPRCSDDAFLEAMDSSARRLKESRPTAVNLEWAVNRQVGVLNRVLGIDGMIHALRQTADRIADEDSEYCRRIGEHGLRIIEEIRSKKGGERVNILTHCNAGWLAFVDYGTATAPIYEAHDAGIRVHVWVDETRPRNQGAGLTAWELGQHGVPHTVIVDNAGGHLMQHGRVDMVITGTDRTLYTGDVANKIGTYLKALAARRQQHPLLRRPALLVFRLGLARWSERNPDRRAE